ncbi:hypothetical protein LLG46_13670 [bacterium]|nr:hypothetical protein [bacterium]
MEINEESKTVKKKYVSPETVKHEPLDIVRGSGSYSSLYYTYYYYYYY